MGAEIKGLRRISEWLKLVENKNSKFADRISEIYGDDDNVKLEAANLCLRTLEEFAKRYGPNRSVLVAHSAGRVNLLGTHIDHRGGMVNPVAIKQMWLVAEPRDDNLVLVKNAESDKFSDEQFQISKCLPTGKKIKNWDAWCHDELEKRKNDPTVTWSNYVRSVVLYFQHLNTNDDGCFTKTLKGMNTMFYGNIPRAAGVSSSSALVMAVAEVLMRINSLEIEPMELVEQCGYAEWYVGTRGGCSDQAAIKFGKPNMILHVSSLPVKISSTLFPSGYKIILVNSLVEAKKQVGARNIYNNRIASYNFGFMMIRRNFPQYADKLEHLHDLNSRTLGVDEAEIYRIVKSLPESAGRDDILKTLPEHQQKIRHIFRSHDEPEEGYKIRQICLYGITECIRAGMVPECLRTGDIKTFGELMNTSHDGDRVTMLVSGKRIPTDNSYPDARIDALIKGLESDDPRRADSARLWRQPGGYNVSVPEMDILVDIALATPGVVGAGLVGAGTGGSIVVIAEDKHVQQVIDNMAEQYYRHRNLPVEAEIVSPAAGCGVIDV